MGNQARTTKKNRTPMVIKVVFGLLAIGFTGISAVNGLHFYNVIFGIKMAVMITGVFEIARLACLFRFADRKRAELLSIIIYIAVASTCAFASVNSFSSRVIFRSFAEEIEQAEKIREIKQAYSERTEKTIQERTRDIRYIENIIAKNPERDSSDYWNRRLSQIKANYHDIITERDKFLATDPENPNQWIQANAPMLGVKLGPESEESKEIRSVAMALEQLWGLEKKTAKKLVGAVVTVVVELSILLLAFLSSVEKAQYGKEKSRKSATRNEILESLFSDFDEKTVMKFLSVSEDCYRRTGKLPPMRKLSPNLRKVKKALENFDQESLKKLFGRSVKKGM
ncbi:MAG: hypothetical protein ACOC5S_05465 [Acidobacteriota bacterium]